MELYWKVIGAILTALILGLHLGKQERDFSILLAITVCCLGATIALSFLEPVLNVLREMEALICFEEGILNILIKSVGIALTTEVAAMICYDAGSNSMGKMVHLLGTAVILYLSVPVMTALLKMLREILGGI